MVDVLVMLTEAYYCLNRYEYSDLNLCVGLFHCCLDYRNDDAMKSARLAVDLIHSNIEKSRVQDNFKPSTESTIHPLHCHANNEEVDEFGFRLPRHLSQICCYYGLAVLLHNSNLLKFAIGWYKRSVAVAEHHNVDLGVLTYLKDCYRTAQVSLQPEDTQLTAKQQAVFIEPSGRSIISQPQHEQTRELCTRSLAIDCSVSNEQCEYIPTLSSIGKSKSALPRMLGTSNGSSESSKSNTAFADMSASETQNISMQHEVHKEPLMSKPSIIISSDDALYYNPHVEEKREICTVTLTASPTYSKHCQDSVEEILSKYGVSTDEKILRVVPKIQSVARGYNTRKYVKAVKQHQNFLRRMRSQRKFVVIIQSAVRKYLASCRVTKLRKLRTSIIQGIFISDSDAPTCTTSDFKSVLALVQYLKAERKVIASKKEILIRVTYQEKKKLIKILENVNARKSEHMPNALRVDNSEKTVTKQLNYRPSEMISDERALKVSKILNIPRKALFGAGQKVEAKFMFQHIRKHNITWHKGVIQHVHQAPDLKTMEMNYTYDVKYNNGEIETRITEANVRRPILVYTNPAPLDPTSDSCRPRICVAKRQKYGTDMHRTMMQLQFQAVGRREKRKKERMKCKIHNITIIQRICRGYLVRKYVAGFRSQKLSEKILWGSYVENCEEKRVTGVAKEFSKFSSFSQYRSSVLAHSQYKQFDQCNRGQIRDIGKYDVELHWETQQIHNDIQSYYDLLIQAHNELKELREQIHGICGHFPTTAVETDSPLFARLGESCNVDISDIGPYGERNYLEISGNDVSFYDNSNRVTSSVTTGLVARDVVKTYVENAIQKLKIMV